MSSALLRYSGWSRRLWASLAALLLTVVGAVVAIAPEAAAAPNDPGRAFGTYNMQGSLGGARWSSEVGPMAERIPVVALQEAGSGPPPVPSGFDDSITIPIPGPRPHPNMPMTVNRSPWEYHGQFYTVYFLETHVERTNQGTLRWGGQRNNLAIVTQEHADEVRVVNNPVFNPNSANDDYRSRRALGVRLGDTVYYNIHARGPSDYRQLLGAIRQDVRPGENYVILGDFNRNIRYQDTATARNTVGADPNELLARPDRATHQNDSELDYALTRGTPNMAARVPGGIGADHFPVEFNAPGRPIPAPPNRVANAYPTAYVNVSTGSAMDVPDDSSGRVITHPQRFNAQQRFTTTTYRGHWYAFQHGGSGTQSDSAGTRAAAAEGLCPGANPFDGFKIALLDCDNRSAQWHPESPAALRDEESGGMDSGPVRWRNALWSSLCLTAMGRQETMQALPCTDSDAQLWWESSRAVPSDTWHDGGKWLRLRAHNGSYLDAQGGGNADLTNVIVHPRKNVDNQFWDIQYRDYGDNLVRLRGRDSSKCVDVRNSDTAGPGASSVIFTCDYANSKNDNTGQRWTAETDPDGDIRFRNEATHLCLVAPEAETGQVTVDECSTSPRQVWVPEA
ncbi:hypothetical protein G5C60_21785 [Streptomyces sp. HC44]|uniref:Ricin B lectin domain-containing protein n=1 Tax=Streptomyces scabichelini TaxID=2711217 RepID=A0A6G4V8J1_9ACTN|nr:ricin-type beta-trefoil lectin domain protein [Streptomyces scabichelini]NGO10147.1 hypothetical protein [Streptomyces scabichelini]